MVNRLITKSIKVNIPAAAESQSLDRDTYNDQEAVEPLELPARFWLGPGRRFELRHEPAQAGSIAVKKQHVGSAREIAGAFLRSGAGECWAVDSGGLRISPNG